ncbi:MAG: branched-chain amino acid ABC transporter permease [OCS116 cluster bacterium]|nr:branched-chain amino acid ABC transporter permease [OCS116 cluster bacterium]
MLELTLQAIYTGLLSGGFYALVAVGLALIFGTMKVINLAHGELVLLAAYVAYATESKLGLNPLLALPIAMAVVVSAALLTYFLTNHIKKDRELNSLILTFGLGIILTNSLLMVFSANIYSTSTEWFFEGVVIGDTLFSMRSELLAFVVGVLSLGGLYWWLNHTWHGRAIRAVSSNLDAAKLMGMNPKQAEMWSWGVAGILATLAGCMLYTTSVIHPPIGHGLTIKAFIITVLAGMGSIPGVLVGAFLIAIIESLTATFFQSSLSELASMGIFLVVLIVLPSGLFGNKRIH